jgi:hypothetical protein
MPTEEEPTYVELQRLFNETSECALIESQLGKDYLGCEFTNPTSSCSCNCPEQGKYFYKYLATKRTYSTFFGAIDQPLRRQAQVAQLQAQMIKVKIPPNDTINVGSLVEIFNTNDHPEYTSHKYKKISGKWMVAEIDHQITNTGHILEATLIRNGLHYDPNESKTPQAIFVGKTNNQ